MLSKPNVAELEGKAKNRYEVALAVAKRARQISHKRVEEGDADITDPVDVAAHEIEDGKIVVSEKSEEVNE